jgi:TolA-binding protein
MVANLCGVSVLRDRAVPHLASGHATQREALSPGRPWAGPLGRARFVPRFCLLLFTAFCLRCLAAPSDAAPRETRDLLRKALNAGAYDQAVPLIQQLIEWFKDSRQVSLQRDLEQLRFQLGLCHYLTGSFADSEKSFGEYLSKYRVGSHAAAAAVFLGDGLRFSNQLDPALKQYESARRSYEYNADWTADILCSMARCRLAKENWGEAIPLLREVYHLAPDETRADWAAALICTAYLKELRLEEVYRLVPYLLQADAPAARSVAFNVAALEAGDALFADERYRDALWVYRLVTARSVIEERTRRLVRDLKADVEDLREAPGSYRELLRAQEALSEAAAELKALSQLPDYESELHHRIARSYMEVRRFREARVLFLHLRSQLPPEQAEEPLYLAFHCSTQLSPWDRAIELGNEYMKAYPKGAFYDTVSLAVGQMYGTLKDWPRVLAVLGEALRVHPEHENAAECLFLLGYASFMEEQFPAAVRWLKDLGARFPLHERVEESTYWLGMALLFNRAYEDALRLFETYAEQFPKSPYLEDVEFRRAVCEYGLSRFEEAARHFAEFVARRPQSDLTGEVFMMMADMAGAEGRLQAAVELYRQASDGKLNAELYNHCCFRAGEMLADLQDFVGLVDHFRAYIERRREDSNLPLAVYWIGRGLWQQGRQQEAMASLLEAVDQYGRDPGVVGVDLILEEWVNRSKTLTPAVAKEAWREFGERLVRARQESCLTLQLRLERIFLYHPEITDKAREILLGTLLREDAVAHASPGVLEFLMQEAPRQGHPEIAQAAARQTVQAFAETDSVLPARMVLAEAAMQRQDFAAAEDQLKTVREVFASSLEAGRALVMLGNLYLQQRRFGDADRCFRDVLGVREWRGPLWPEALYGRGECARAQRQFAAATAFYERIYVLYSSYRDWCAKAYLVRAQCLLQLQEEAKANETLTEMLAHEDLANSLEAAAAKELLGRLERRATP